jgi:phosphoglycolate phosphatase
VSSRYAVVLWDVDGTLIHCGGAGRRALDRALGEACGPLDAKLAALRLDGMTDRLIVREAFALLAHPWSDTACDAILDRYLAHLAVEIQHPSYQVLPGVTAALEALAARGAAFGLCTGNVAAGARVKLARGGLERFFEWGEDAIGGFAADGEARERVVAAAVARAGRRLGRPVDPREALVVGDTPRDVSAAHQVGCPVLAVATGRFDAAALRSTGADHVVESLLDPAAARLLGL